MFAVLLAVGAGVMFLMRSRIGEQKVPGAPTANAPAAPNAMTAPGAPAEPLPPLDFGDDLLDRMNGEVPKDTPAHVHALQTLAEIPAGDVTARAKGYLDYAEALKNPEALRGQCVRKRGLIVAQWADKLEQPVNGVEDVYRAFLSDSDASDGVMLDMLHPIENVEQRRDVVDVEGVFYRIVSHEPGRKPGMKAIPVPCLLLRNLTVIDSSQNRADRSFGTPDVIVMLLLGVGFAWLLFRVSTFTKRARGIEAPAYAFKRKRRSALLPPRPKHPKNPDSPPGGVAGPSQPTHPV